MMSEEQRMKEIIDEYNEAWERIHRGAYDCLDFGSMPNLSILYPAPDSERSDMTRIVEVTHKEYRESAFPISYEVGGVYNGMTCIGASHCHESTVYTFLDPQEEQPKALDGYVEGMVDSTAKVIK